jgi:hypothetical protein
MTTPMPQFRVVVAAVNITLSPDLMLAWRHHDAAVDNHNLDLVNSSQKMLAHF